jgi:Zn-dependent protease with chaperone function
VPVDSSGGFLLSLLTESFAVRALIGSLAAAALAALVVHLDGVRSSRARRILLLAPVLTAAIAALASLRHAEAYLPQLWVASTVSGPPGQLLELLGELRALSTERGVDMLALGYLLVVAVLLTRRFAGHLAVRRLLVPAIAPTRHVHLVTRVNRLSAQMGIRAPRVLLLPGCPGGAFTAGLRRPVVVVDTALLHQLDEREMEGLLAHELAHIARRDTLVGLVVGVFRDCTFFLPPIHLAARWLRNEQEESADELASRHTGRPGALASSILKVWDRTRARHLPAAACAAVPVWGLRPVAVGGRPPAPAPLSETARALAVRVERLISLAPAVSSRRRRIEVSLAGLVLAAATGTSIAVPAWFASQDMYGVSFAVLSAHTTPVESPAFATFRALTPQAGETGTTTSTIGGTLDAGDDSSACPCLETRAQLRGEVAATGPRSQSGMLWAPAGADAWELPERAAVRARPLWTLTDSGPQVGFFLVGRPAAS